MDSNPSLTFYLSYKVWQEGAISATLIAGLGCAFLLMGWFYPLSLLLVVAGFVLFLTGEWYRHLPYLTIDGDKITIRKIPLFKTERFLFSEVDAFFSWQYKHVFRCGKKEYAVNRHLLEEEDSDLLDNLLERRFGMKYGGD